MEESTANSEPSRELPGPAEFDTKGFADLAGLINKIVLSLLVGSVGAVLYSWTASDAMLIGNLPARSNPVSAVEISFLAFGILVPLAILCGFLFLHIHLQRLWDMIAEPLPSPPSGRGGNSNLPYWFGVGIFEQQRAGTTGRSPLAALERLTAVVLLWAMVPTALALIWLRYFVCHEWHLSLLHNVLLAIGVTAAYSFWELANLTIGGSPGFLWDRGGVAHAWARDSGLKEPPGAPTSVRHVFTAVAVMAVTGVFSMVAIQVLAWPPADLAFAQLSMLPSDAKEGLPDNATQSQIDRVRGARLRNRDLRRCQCDHAFLVRADLAYARLEGADLSGADLRSANLDHADLTGVRLRGTDLRGVNLQTLKTPPAPEELALARK